MLVDRDFLRGIGIKELLNISDSDSERLVGRLQRFVSDYAGSLDDFLRSQTGNPAERRSSRPKWTEFLGFVKATDVPNNGVGQTFLVAWNHEGTNRTGDRPDPMVIWIAKGIEIKNDGPIDALMVEYIQVSEFDHQTAKFSYLLTPPRKSSIYFNSQVVLP